MQCRHAAAQIVVVHRGQIIVYQGKCMDELDGCRRGIERRRRHAQAFAARIHEQRPHAFTTVENGIAHCIVQPARRMRCRRQNLIQLFRHAFRVGSNSFVEARGQVGLRSVLSLPRQG